MKKRSRPSLGDVAEEAEVAVSVVSRILSGEPTLKVRSATRARVIRVANEIGYVPQYAARALRTARTDTVALCIPDVMNPLFQEIREGVEVELERAGYSLMFADSDNIALGSPSYRRLIANGRVDGVIIQRSAQLSDREFYELVSGGLPTVLVNSSVSDADVSSVVLPDVEAMWLAVRYLSVLGHRDVGLLLGPGRLDWAGRRSVGFSKAVEHFGLNTRPEWQVAGGYTVSAGEAGLRDLVTIGDRPSAVVVENVMAGVGAIAEARKVGLSVPEDISIIAIHDLWIADYVVPRLTTIKLPLRELGVRAAELLVDQLNSPGGVARQVGLAEFPPVLVERESVGRK